MRKLLSAIAMAALCHPAFAICDDPSHICVVGYSETTRYDILGVVGQPTTITFPAGEQVYRNPQKGWRKPDNTLSDEAWQLPTPAEAKDQPLGNVLPLWPTPDAAKGETIMTAVTMLDSPHGCDPAKVECKMKVYAFTLHALPADAPAEAMRYATFNLIFKGDQASHVPAQSAGRPVTVARPLPNQAAKVDKAKERAEAEERLRTEAFNQAGGQCFYHAKGQTPSSITPRCPMDNGEWTLIRFPGLSRKPAVYIASNDRCEDERLARQHGTGDFVVVEEIAPFFCLRLGADVVAIINDHYNAAGTPHGNTIVPEVKRDLIAAQK